MATYNLSWFQNAIEDVKNEMVTVVKLKEIKVALTGLHANELSSLSSALDIHVLFDCLNCFEKKQTELTCEVLRILLSSLSTDEIFRRHSRDIIKALTHPEKLVKELILHELHRGAESHELSKLLTEKPELLLNVFELLKDEELSVAQLAVKFITGLGGTDSGFRTLVIPPHTSFMLSCLRDSNTVHALRVYQVIVELGAVCGSRLKKLEDVGLIDGLLSLLTSEDILVQLAAIEELSKLALTSHGYTCLTSHDVIRLLARQFLESEHCPLFLIIFPGLMKFFGSLCYLHAAEIHEKHPEVVSLIIHSTTSVHLVISITALESVAFIASSTYGRLLLNSLGDDEMKKMMLRMQEMIAKGQEEWKVRALGAAKNILTLELNDPKAAELSRIAEKWFDWLLGPSGADYLLKLVESPFPDVKLASLQVVKQLAYLKWGQEKIAKIKDFVKFLVDRGTESSMAGLVIKFEIIEILAESLTASDIFSEEDYARILQYKKHGVSYKAPIVKVAVEGAE